MQVAGNVEDAEPAAPGDGPLIPLRSTDGLALIGATALASSVAAFDANVVKVAVPAIGRDLHAGVGALQWTLTGYLLAVAALLLVSGGLADHFGRRRVLTFGLLVTLVASVLCGVAPSVGALIGARVAQGVGGACIVPSSLAMLNGTLRITDRPRGIGVWAGLGTLGTTFVPYGGGWLVDHVSWRAVFYVNIPLVVAALLILRLVPEAPESLRPLSLDLTGACLAVVGLGGVVYALTSGSTAGWTSRPVLLSAAFGVGALAALLPVERRARAPMLRLSLFTSRQFNAINATTILVYGALGTAGYLVILRCELQLGYSTATAGAALIPQSAVFLAISPLGGALVARLGTRWMMASGIAAVGGSFAWLSQAGAGSTYAGTILPAAVLWGVGVGVMVAPLTAGVLAAVQETDLGEASAINNTAARVGALFTIAIVPALIGANRGRSLAQALARGYEPAMLCLAGVCLAGSVIAVLFVSDQRPAADRLPPVLPTDGCALAQQTTSEADAA